MIGRRARDLLASFRLTDAADRAAKTYSGGMRRRLDLAASLVNRPRVLYLDEPTTGLDPLSRNEMWDVVRGLTATGVTVLLTTQYLEEADLLASEIAVIDHGTVIATGTPTELIGEPLPGLLVHLQGRAATPRRAQGAHQQAGQRLAHRVRDDQALEFGDQRRGDSGAQVSIDAVLSSEQAQLVQPGDDGPAELGLGHLGQRRAAPQPERPPQGGGGRGRIGSARSLAPPTSSISPEAARTSSDPSIATCTRSILPDSRG